LFAPSPTVRPRVYWFVSGEAVVLKVSPDRSLIVAEAATLDLWRASGRVPELFEFNDDSGALLMEALRPDTALTSGMKKSRLSEVVGLVRDLHAGADEAVLAGFPPLIERVEFIFEFWDKRCGTPRSRQ
jgi:streptomycin 6-kinase